MVRVLFLTLIFTIILQPARAANLCSFLDKVAASTREKSPFSSVKYLDVPGGECRVDDVKGHLSRGVLVISNEGKSLKKSWACFWNIPRKSENARLLDAEMNFRQITEQVDEANRIRKKKYKIYRRTETFNSNFRRIRDEFRRAKWNSNKFKQV